MITYFVCWFPQNAGQDTGDHDNAYTNLGNIVKVDLVKFSYQIASGMVSGYQWTQLHMLKVNLLELHRKCFLACYVSVSTASSFMHLYSL